MILQDFHTHTIYCDGKNTPEEMVLSAIEKNMDAIGICCHSYVFFDERYCIKKDKISEFQAEISALKEKYADKIDIFCGVEQDYYSEESTEGFDYVIGSVHFLKNDGKYYEIDICPERLEEAVKNIYNDDWYLMAEDYFDTVSKVAEKTNCHIIGHIDLITKFNEGYRFFDEKNERYVKAYKSAVDRLLKYDVAFEINTGAISRGYRTKPYPSADILEYIRQNGGKTILSSDAHNKENLCFGFKGDYNMDYIIKDENGFERCEFVFNSHHCVIIKPKEVAEGAPWVWRAEFLGAFDYADKALLAKGWHIAYCDLSNKFGSPDAIEKMKEFKEFITKEFKLNPKADIFGFSRGGLYTINYSVKYPEDISTIYLDAPVLDLKSWPLGSGNGKGSQEDAELCIKEYGVEKIEDIKDSPIYKLDLLNETGLPIILFYCDADEVVPYPENCIFLEKGYIGKMKVIPKAGVLHHPHSLENPEPIVKFIEENRK